MTIGIAVSIAFQASSATFSRLNGALAVMEYETDDAGNVTSETSGRLRDGSSIRLGVGAVAS